MAGVRRQRIIVKAKKKKLRNRDISHWAEWLMKSVNAVMAVRPEADPDNIRHTHILLEQPPLDRLRRSLIRGRSLAQHK
jgi:hypothetical protein